MNRSHYVCMFLFMVGIQSTFAMNLDTIDASYDANSCAILAALPDFVDKANAADLGKVRSFVIGKAANLEKYLPVADAHDPEALGALASLLKQWSWRTHAKLLQQYLERAQKEVSDLTVHLNGLKLQIDAKPAELSAARADGAKSREAEISGLQKQLNDLRPNLERAQKEVSDLTVHLNGLKLQIDAKPAELSAARADGAKSREAEISGLQKQLDEIRKRLAGSEEERKNATCTITVLQAALEAKDKQISQLRNSVKTAQRTLPL